MRISPNKPDPANAAMALWFAFHNQCRWVSVTGVSFEN
jgi:hypothetical protein